MNQIKRLRTLHGIKQADLAKMLKVSQAALSGYETGKFEAPLDTYIAIADYFGVTVDYLLGRTDIKNPALMVESGAGERLSESEQEMLSLFRSLNDEGQLSALAMLRGLAASPAYIKSPVPRQVQEEIG